MTKQNFPFSGVHLLGELFGIKADILNDEEALSSLVRQAVSACHAELCSLQSKKFQPQGVSIVALLAESHASLHTFPEVGALFFDIFTCGTRTHPQLWVDCLVEALNPQHANIKRVQRGMTEDETLWHLA